MASKNKQIVAANPFGQKTVDAKSFGAKCRSKREVYK